MKERCEHYIWSGQKRLRCGYTTGSCAAAAAKAALLMLTEQKKIEEVSLLTPKGVYLNLEVEDSLLGPGYAQCGIRKDAGDDPDVTDGLLIMARVELTKESGIKIDGGVGVGRVTRKGLEQPVGSAAINSVPRKMIMQELEQVLQEHHLQSGASVVISVPEGERIAAKTFNPRLGILGGISILGTSGIVVPMSEQALLDSIRVEMKQHLANGSKLLIAAPGNYGEAFSYRNYGIEREKVLIFSNFAGDMLDMAVELGAERILMIGHIGKFVKLAGGIMNTHSRNADARAEILASNSALCGAALDTVKRIACSNTTDEALTILEDCGLKTAVCDRLLSRMLYYLGKRCQDRLEIGIILFSNQHGVLKTTENAERLLQEGNNTNER